MANQIGIKHKYPSIDRTEIWYLIGVPVAPFPRWLLCPVCRKLAPIESGLFELRVNAVRPDGNKYVHTNCGKARTPPTALPARFTTTGHY